MVLLVKKVERMKHMQNPNISDDMFTRKELDDLYGTKFTFHENLPPSYSTDCMTDTVADASGMKEISCAEDKYDHDIERLMAYSNKN